MRPSRNRRTTSVEERRVSPRPSTCAGHAMTVSSPRAATRSASTSPASLESAYGMPSGTERTWRSSAVPPRDAGPIAATDETCTARRTPSASAASMTTRVPSAFSRNNSSSGSRRLVDPATWNNSSTSRRARRIARRSVTSAVTSRTPSPASASRLEDARTATRTSSPRSTSSLVTCAPMKPVAPVTSTLATPGRLLGWSAMPSVAVVTDSTHYLPAEVVERHGLHDVSLYVNWKGKTRRESEMRDYDAFYDELRTASELPSTSQPSVGDFLAVYEPLLESGQDILSVHISGGISGTVGAAEQARESLIEQGVESDRIRVIDSRTGCAAFGLVAIAAANAVRDGADVAGAAEAAERLREAVQIWFAVDTLEYLRRGGRIGAAGAWGGAGAEKK